MDRHSNVVQNENGRAIAGASVLVLDASGQIATLFEDRGGAIPLDNPLVTDSLGRFSFCAADGLYSAQVSLGRVPKATLSDIRLEDPLDNPVSYVLPVATSVILGGVKAGVGVTIAVDGTLSFTQYSLPIAGASTLGGVKIGSGLAIDAGGILSATGVASGSVASVNGQNPNGSGAVTLTTDNIAESGTPTNQWFSAARVRDAVLTGLSAASGAVITAADTVLGALGKLQKQVLDLAANIAAKQDAAAKDASSGFAGLTGFAINIKNAAGTVISKLVSVGTAVRTYTFPDKDGTVAMLSDITGGSMVLLGSVTASSPVASIDFLNIFSGTYDTYVIDITNLNPSSGSATPVMNLAYAGAVDATATYGNLVTNGSTASGNDSINLSLSTGVNSAYSATLRILNARGTTGVKSIGAQGSFVGVSGVYALSAVGYQSKSAAASGFRINFTVDNVVSGTVRVYGIKNS